MKLTIKKILEICDGKLLSGSEEVVIENYSKDTRTLQPNDCYVGIKGENFDGNKYYMEARKKGACACILDSFSGNLDEVLDYPILLVSNTIEVLGKLASYVRSHAGIPVVAVTGSVGKTSTKDMIASVLSEKYKVLKSPGNLNGQIGLPFNILSLKDEEIMVLEMGMNDFGQIHNLSNIAEPTIGVITNIGTAHIGILGSRENILKAKLEILDGMKENSTLIINGDNDLLATLDLPNYSLVRCGRNEAFDYYVTNIKKSIYGSEFDVVADGQVKTMKLPIMGDVFIQNSLLAIAVGRYFHMTLDEIEQGILKVQLSQNRMEVCHLKQQITLINDTYNSNFEAVESALNILKEYSGIRKIAVLGDILEMEDFSEEIHSRIGRLPILNEIDAIFLAGESSKFIRKSAMESGIPSSKIFYCESNEELNEKLQAFLKPQDTVLLKASHGMAFDKIAENLKKIFS